MPEPELLAPPLDVLAVEVPFELLPPLAVSAVPVPPEFGVDTGGVELGGPALAGLFALPLSSPAPLVVSSVPAVVLCCAITPWQ